MLVLIDQLKKENVPRRLEGRNGGERRSAQPFLCRKGQGRTDTTFLSDLNDQPRKRRTARDVESRKTRNAERKCKMEDDFCLK